MAFSIQRMTTRGLLGAWGVYWLGLLVIAGLPLLRMAAVVARSPTGHSSVSAGITDGILSITGMVDGRVLVGGTLSMLSLALWVAGPPLVLWMLWLVMRPRHPAPAATEDAPRLPPERWPPLAPDGHQERATPLGRSRDESQ